MFIRFRWDFLGVAGSFRSLTEELTVEQDTGPPCNLRENNIIRACVLWVKAHVYVL